MHEFSIKYLRSPLILIFNQINLKFERLYNLFTQLINLLLLLCSFYSSFRAFVTSTISHHFSLFLLASSSILFATFARSAFNVSIYLCLGRLLGLIPLILTISTCLHMTLSFQTNPALSISLLLTCAF